MPTKELQKMLEPYGYKYAFTDSLLSDAHSKAKLDLFGQPSDNVKYASGVLENKRYDQFKKEAWCHTQPLTPRGMKLMADVFQDVEVNEYYCDVSVMDTY
jgi:hypothetical protein